MLLNFFWKERFDSYLFPFRVGLHCFEFFIFFYPVYCSLLKTVQIDGHFMLIATVLINHKFQRMHFCDCTFQKHLPDNFGGSSYHQYSCRQSTCLSIHLPPMIGLSRHRNINVSSFLNVCDLCTPRFAPMLSVVHWFRLLIGLYLVSRLLNNTVLQTRTSLEFAF